MLKKILVTTFTVVIIIVIAVVVTPMFIPANKFRQTITEYAQELIGQNVSIRGNISFKAFPYIGIYMENVTVGKPNDRSMPALGAFKALNVEIAAIPLFTGNVVIKSLVLEEPSINLIVSADGKQNWLPTYEKPVEKTEEDAPVVEKAKVSISDVIKNLMLDDVRISKGHIIYKNAATKESWELKNVNVAFFLDNVTSPFEVKGDVEYNNDTIKYGGTIETFQTMMSDGRGGILLNVQGSRFTAKLDGNFDKTNFSGKTSISTPSLTELTEWATAKPLGTKFSSKFPLTLSSDTACSADMCAFTKSDFKLDSIEAKGDVKLRFTGAVPYVELKLDTNEIDFNLFKAKPVKESTSLIGSAYAAEPSDWSDETMDFSALRSVNMIGNINAKGLRFDNIKIGKTIFRSKIQHGRLSADILDAEFYSGKANIFVNIDASSSAPIIEKRVSFTGVQMEPLLIDADVTDRFSGKANIQVNVATQGRTEREMVSNLQGTGSIKCEDGSIKGINIAEMVRNVQSAFKSVDKSSQKTDFSEAGGTFTITKGVLSNNDLMMKAPLFRVKGNGVVDMPKRSVNYKLSPEVVQTIQGQGGKEKQGIGVPVIIEGNFENLHYRPDLESTIRDAIKNPEKVKETISNIKDQIKQNKSGLKDLLKKF